MNNCQVCGDFVDTDVDGFCGFCARRPSCPLCERPMSPMWRSHGVSYYKLWECIRCGVEEHGYRLGEGLG